MDLKIDPLPARQVHLDFHTSPYITGVAAEFDAPAFARRMREAHVNSVTVFAKCHHGMSYYPTRLGEAHPHLRGRDLLGECIEALHREGIRAPVYTTVVWEERVADLYPQWRQMYADGRFVQVAASADMKTLQPGRWRFNNFADPDYQDYFEAHLAEILDAYPVDGFFIDIVFMDAGACFSEASMRKREKLGLTGDTARDNALFESAMQCEFAERFTRFIRGRAPKAGVFYNSTNKAYVTAGAGWRARARRETHVELESLPSGFWGYHHYPRFARQLMLWGQPWLGMTGRFQKMWGDFGGLKPQPALEYECFRAQAMGGGCSVGDQLHPRGGLDEGAYRLIGSVYSQVEAAEPLYAGTTPCPTVGVLLAAAPGSDENRAGKSEEGVVLMLEELKYDAALLDDEDPLDGFAVVVLPDSTVITPALRDRLRTYCDQGGKLILSFDAGRDEQGTWALDWLPVQIGGLDALYPSYLRARPGFLSGYAEDCRVVYSQGRLAKPGRGADLLVERIPPYFKRNDLRFCSHFQTPPDPTVESGAAVVGNAGFVYFADPVFLDYRQSGNRHLRDFFARALEILGASPLLGPGLPAHVLAVPRRKDADLILTLLNYLPTRKSHDIDVIEDALSFAGMEITLPKASRLEAVLPKGLAVTPAGEGKWLLPNACGRLILRAPQFYQ
ncbi:MAG: alpha-L-fucosidase [Opitutales bacterium]|nr:alpha-L-fucosidase [Opitutales bacterium]